MPEESQLWHFLAEKSEVKIGTPRQVEYEGGWWGVWAAVRLPWTSTGYYYQRKWEGGGGLNNNRTILKLNAAARGAIINQIKWRCVHVHGLNRIHCRQQES